MAMLRNRPRIMNAGDLTPMSRGGDSQFVVDTSHPHLAGCAGLFLLDDFQSGTIKNHMGGEPAILQNGNSWDSRRSISCNSGSSEYIEFPAHIRPTAFPFALRIVTRHIADTTSARMAIGTTATNDRYVSLNITGGSNAVYGIYQEGTTSSERNIAQGPSNLVAGEEYDIIGVFREGGWVHVYVNGVSVANDPTDTLSFGSFDTFNFCRLQRATSIYNHSSDTSFIQVFHNDPTANVFAMAQDRYAFIRKPVNNRFFFTAAPAGGFFARRYYDSMIGGKS